MRFHCTRELFEHPVLIVEAFGSHGVDLELDAALSKAVGNIDGDSVSIAFHPKRFRANLAVLEYPSMLPLRPSSPARETLSRVLFDLGIVEVESPVDEEIQHVENHFEQTQAIRSTVCRIRDEDALKWQMVEEQDFEKALYHRTQQRALMDRLYDLCMGTSQAR